MKRRWFLTVAFLLPLLTGSTARGDEVTVRWDIVHVTFAPLTFVATGFIKFDVGPGIGGGAIDLIGPIADSHDGLAFLRIRYSDGSRGVLVVSCRFNPGAVFEGITASKGFVDYWSHVGPVPGVDGGRTLFHFVSSEDEQR